MKVIKGNRFIYLDERLIKINYFPNNTLPTIDFSHPDHLFVTFNLEKKLIYILGELTLSADDNNKKLNLINKNMINGQKLFTSFDLLKPFRYVSNRKKEKKIR